MIDLKREASLLHAALKDNRRDAINDENALDVQALCVAEEAGELVSAYRRWAGKARRNGTLEELEHEVADVLIVTSIFALRAGIDLDKALRDKLDIIWSRGWKEEEAK